MKIRRSCTPLVKALEKKEILALLPELGISWRVENDFLIGEWRFAEFSELARFIRAVLRLSTRQNHHPQVSFGYRDCRISYTTHSAGGLSENDFICAAKINTLTNHIAPPVRASR